MEKHVYAALKRVASEIAEEAKASHRYRNRTGNLTRSVRYWVKKAEQKMAVYASESQAPYAKYVIGGHRTWAPDPFIEAAFARNKDWIDDQFRKAINDATREFNKLNRL